MKFYLPFVSFCLMFVFSAEAQLTANPYQDDEHNTVFAQNLINGNFGDLVSVFGDEAMVLTSDAIEASNPEESVSFWQELNVLDIKLSPVLTTYSWHELEKSQYWIENKATLDAEVETPVFTVDNFIYQLLEVRITTSQNGQAVTENFPMIRIWLENGENSYIMMDSFKN